MKTTGLFSALCLAAMLLAEGTVNAVPMHQLIFTENSPTSLTATFDGSTTGVTVTNVRNDLWNVILGLAPSSGGVNWFEPENNGLVNSVATTQNPFLYVVTSDGGPLVPGSPTFPDGTQVNFGIDAGDRVPILATFHDHAATAEVPDAAPTAILLGIALLGMEGLRRRFRTA